MKLQIDLPDFDGFYNTIFDDIYEVSDDLESYGDVSQEDYDNIDWNATQSKLANNYLSHFFDENKDWLLELGVKSMTFVKVDSPAYYNFTTDKLVCDVNFDSHKFRREIKRIVQENSQQFDEFIDENYSSRSGFCSFYSNNSDVWLGEYLKDKLSNDNVVFEGFLQFAMIIQDYDKESITNKVLEETYQYLTFLETAQ